MSQNEGTPKKTQNTNKIEIDKTKEDSLFVVAIKTSMNEGRSLEEAVAIFKTQALSNSEDAEKQLRFIDAAVKKIRGESETR